MPKNKQKNKNHPEENSREYSGEARQLENNAWPGEKLESAPRSQGAERSARHAVNRGGKNENRPSEGAYCSHCGQRKPQHAQAAENDRSIRDRENSRGLGTGKGEDRGYDRQYWQEDGDRERYRNEGYGNNPETLYGREGGTGSGQNGRGNGR